jgi:nitroreductase
MMQLPKVEMNVFETILARRSVRDYTPQALSSVKLRTLLEAAVRAPTAMHEEPWAFTIVQDRAVLDDISERGMPLFMEHLRQSGQHFELVNNPAFNLFYNAGTLIVICAKPIDSFYAADCWLAAENLMLAACAMGLGSCVIGAVTEILNNREVKASLGIPKDFEAIVPIVVGYPNGETAASARKRPNVLNTLPAKLH